MQNHYEINVSKNGKHFFATAARSCRDEDQAKAVYTELLARFPESEGYEVDVTHWSGMGTRVKF